MHRGRAGVSVTRPPEGPGLSPPDSSATAPVTLTEESRPAVCYGAWDSTSENVLFHRYSANGHVSNLTRTQLSKTLCGSTFSFFD